MAEIVGTAAAVLQLTETAWKLKELYSNIRNAPKDLSDLVEEVAILADLLADVGKHRTVQRQTLADANSWDRCYKLLQASVVGIKDVTSDLESTLNIHKWTGRIRVHLKRDEFGKYLDRMERVKTTMMAAQQVYSFALLTQQNAMLLKEIRSFAIDQQVANQTVQSTVTHTSNVTQETHRIDTYAGPQGSSDTAVSRLRIERTVQTRRSYAYDFRLPRWIYRKGLTILIESSNNSWSATFRTYNQRPSDADVFQHALHGRWHDVRLLFEAGHASLFDIDARSRSLLHIALETADYRGCEFLLQYGTRHSGAWRFDYSWIDTITLPSFLAQQRFDPGAANFSIRVQKMFTLILPAVRESIFYDSELILRAMIRQLPFGCIKLMADELLLSYENVDALQRALYAILSQSLDAQTIFMFLGRDQTLDQAFKLLRSSAPYASHRLLFAITAEKIGVLYNDTNPESSAVREWVEILNKIVSFEAATSTVLPFYSGLWSFLVGRFSTKRLSTSSFTTLDQTWTTEAKIWLQILRDIGVDLELYGRAEKRYLLDESARNEGPQLGQYVYVAAGICTKYQVGYMTYGSEIDNWALWVVPRGGEHYEMAAAFWDFVENPELFDVPGTFVDTDENEPELFQFLGGMLHGKCM